MNTFGRWIAIFAVTLTMVHSANAQVDTSPLQIKSGNWTTTNDNGVFADTWASGAQQFAFKLLPDNRHFVLELSGFPLGIPDGIEFWLHLVFDRDNTRNASFQFPTMATGSSYTAQIPDDEVAAFTHALTASSTVEIFGRGSVWFLDLAGTTPTISVMADAIAFAGIKGLPAPFDDAMENPTSNPPPPITESMTFSRYGYDFIILDQTVKIPDTESDTGSNTLKQQLPQAFNPITPQAIIFNKNIRRFLETAWSTCGGPKTFNYGSKPPGMDFNLWAATGTSDNDPLQDLQDTLPGVISIRFEFDWDTPPGHPGTCILDFNWLLAKERTVELSDIFVANQNWQKAMINNVSTQRPQWPGSWPEPDLSKQIIDPKGWLLRKEGIEIVFSQGEFMGIEDGGATMGVTVPWLALKPYLKKGGLVSVP